MTGLRMTVKQGVHFSNDSQLQANEVGDRLNDNEDKVDDDLLG